MLDSKSILSTFTLVLCIVTSLVQVDAGRPMLDQNVMARRHHHAVIHSRRHESNSSNRAHDFGGAKRFSKKRSTAAQRDAVASLNEQAATWAKQNEAWQQAAMASLKNGQQPQTFDEFMTTYSGGGAKGGDSKSNSNNNEKSKSNNSEKSKSSDDNNNNEDDTDCSTPDPVSTEPSQSNTKEAADRPDHSKDDHPNNSGESNGSSKHVEKAHPTPSAASEAPKPEPTKSSSGGGLIGLFNGQGTYYAPGLGSCGWTNSESDFIVALSESLYDSFNSANPNNNPVCGHMIKATYQGKSITVKAVDRCTGCAYGSLDFSPSAFQELAPLGIGRLDGIEWSWIGGAPKPL